MINTKIDVSIIASAFNEKDCLAPLMQEIASVMDATSYCYEVIFVDDGSVDRTPNVLADLKEKYSVVRVLRHANNYGQSAGQATGFKYAEGQIIVTMDADGQNDPADIPVLIEALQDDIVCVCGVRRVRMDNRIKKISSKIANSFRNVITNDKVTDAGCTFRAIKKGVLAEVIIFNGTHRFLATILRFQGYRVEEISINHRPRTHGYSKYGINNRLWRGIRDCFAIRWYRARAIKGKRLIDV